MVFGALSRLADAHMTLRTRRARRVHIQFDGSLFDKKVISWRKNIVRLIESCKMMTAFRLASCAHDCD